jgi:hypothetical protein
MFSVLCSTVFCFNASRIFEDETRQNLIVPGHMELEALLPCLPRPEITYRQKKTR